MTLGAATVPSSTYRLQLTERFTLHDAVNIVGYLSDLGVGALYLSPLLRALDGSQHGYDVVDHALVDPARGGDRGLAELSDACRRARLHLVVDIVPNHMGVADPAQNRAWTALLRDGKEASTASWFDVDWVFGGGRVLIPVLADGDGPERDLTFDGEELLYGDHRYPIAPGTRHHGDSPGQVHDRQHYELISASRADTDQNYRRFFAVTDLAGLRIEERSVHEATHREILRWISEVGVTGLRVDHPDGLAQPGLYLDRLAASAPGTWVVVEKILQEGEELPPSWPVAGTTGYDALAQINAVLLDPQAEKRFDAIYREVTGDDRNWEEHAAAGKRHVATGILRAEVNRLARLVPHVEEAAEALTELVVVFPVYRTYLPLGAEHLSCAVDCVAQRRPELEPSLRLLLPRLLDPLDELSVRFAQVTGAVTAKGVEDTAFYRYTRFLGLNEVGGSPGRFGLDLASFHAAQERRAETAPHGMTTLSTHDTKRGEDLRARLAVLAELPDEWARTVQELVRLVPIPNRTFAYLLWQSLVGTGFIDRDRVHAFAEKAMREASEETNWAHPDARFEEAVHAAVDAAYDRPAVRELVASLAQRIDADGWVNALGQKLLQLTLPGVPDVYQGSEFFEASLVDPDNRRVVDFAHLAATLAELDPRQGAGAGPPPFDTPVAKMWITRQTLRARRDRPELFGGYRPLELRTPLDRHLIAFDRGGAVPVITRLPVGLRIRGGWGDASISLPPGTFANAFTGERCEGEVGLAGLLATYPVALLLAEHSS